MAYGFFLLQREDATFAGTESAEFGFIRQGGSVPLMDEMDYAGDADEAGAVAAGFGLGKSVEMQAGFGKGQGPISFCHAYVNGAVGSRYFHRSGQHSSFTLEQSA